MIVYKVTPTQPVPVECETPGYPHRDAGGEVMYRNTHFPTEAEAWARVMDLSESRQILAVDKVEHLRTKLQRALDELDAVSKQEIKTRKNYQEWQRNHLTF